MSTVIRTEEQLVYRLRQLKLNFYRDNVEPIEYVIKLDDDPDPDRFFRGSVERCSDWLHGYESALTL